MSARAARRATKRAEPASLAEMLIAMPEKERRALNEPLTEINKRTYYQKSYADVPPDALLTGQIIRFGTGTSRDFRWSSWATDWHGPHERTADVLASRPANIRSGIATAILRNGTSASWMVVRDLIWRGILEHPSSEAYYLLMIRSLPTVFGTYQPAVEAAREQFIKRMAADTRAVDDFWDALEYEEVVNQMSSNYGPSYVEHIVAAVGEGIVDRSRMLDVAHAGQIRDLRPSASAFFRKIVEGLQPSDDELAARVTTITRILGASQPSEQRTAARALRRFIEIGVEVDGPAIATAAAAPLTGKQKGTAIEVLKLLAVTPIDDETRSIAVVPALGHPHPDVQGAAIDVLEAPTGALAPAVAADVLLWVEAVAPEHRARLIDLAGVGVPRPSDRVTDLGDLEARIRRLPDAIRARLDLIEALAGAKEGRLPPRVEIDDDFDRWTPPVAPIESGEELAEALVTVLAGSPDGIDIERVVDGFARVNPAGVDERVLSPVKKLVRDSEHREWPGWNVPTSLALAAAWWCAGRRPPQIPYLKASTRLWKRAAITHDLTVPASEPREYHLASAHDGSRYVDGMVGFFGARVWEAVSIGTTAARPTLALPTNREGRLQLGDLADRLRQLEEAGAVPGRFEAVQALLRLDAGTGSHDPGLSAGRMPAAVHALYDGKDEGLRRAVAPAAMARRLRIVASSGTSGFPVVRFDFDVSPGSVRRDDPMGQLVHDLSTPRVRKRWWLRDWDDAALRRWALVAFPRHRGLLEAQTAYAVSQGIDAGGTDFPEIGRAALNADRPFDWATHALVAAALLASSETMAATGVDMFEAGANDGRLDASLVGTLIRQLTAAGFGNNARAATRLRPLAAGSLIEADQVRRCLVAWLIEGTDAPRDAHAVLEVLELACDTAAAGIRSAPARAVLEHLASGSSKRAKSAKRLLALEPGDPRSVATAQLELMVERAERWSAQGAVA